MLRYLQENRHLYDELRIKGEFLRNGFNEWAALKGFPFCMTGNGSMFQIHAKAELPALPRDLPGQDNEALGELQLRFRLNGLLLPWMHLAFFSAAHDQQDIEHMLQAFKASVEGVMEGGGE
jgi:glutamate-1-semialdehyde aminotransferase